MAVDPPAAGRVEDALRTALDQGACNGTQARHGRSSVDAVLLQRIAPMQLEREIAAQEPAVSDKDAEVP